MVERAVTELTDSQLLSAFTRGDAGAFMHLYERHARGLYGYALALAGQAELAADCVQELWLKVVKNAHKLAGYTNPRAFFFKTLRNQVYDEFRRRGHERKLTARFAELPLVRPKDGLATAEEAAAIEAAIKELPDEQREVILLRVYGELSFPEIAEITGTPVKTVESRHRLGLEKLREKLE